jgi:hypothetical protein
LLINTACFLPSESVNSQTNLKKNTVFNTQHPLPPLLLPLSLSLPPYHYIYLSLSLTHIHSENPYQVSSFNKCVLAVRLLPPPPTCRCTDKCLWQEINTKSELLTSMLCAPSGGFTHFSRSALQFMVLKNGCPLMALISPDDPSRLCGFFVRNWEKQKIINQLIFTSLTHIICVQHECCKFANITDIGHAHVQVKHMIFTTALISHPLVHSTAVCDFCNICSVKQ